MSTSPGFAEVVVNSTLGGPRRSTRASPDQYRGSALGQTFHYAIPAKLRGQIVPGHLVWLPFGKRELPAIVLALLESSPIAQIKEILELIDPQPVLTSYQLDLMHWVSRYYLAPLHLVAWAMLPPGISWRAEAVFTLGDDGRAVLSCLRTPDQADAQGPAGGEPCDAQERQVLELIEAHGEVPLTELRHALRIQGASRIVERLVRKGWVHKQARIAGPRVKPKVIPSVYLSSAEDTPSTVALRGSKQKAVIEYLHRRTTEPGAQSTSIPLQEVCEAAQVGRGTVLGLVKRGIIALSEQEVQRDPLAGRDFPATSPPRFTQDQASVWQPVVRALGDTQGQTILLHGVTGSGKTEIYLRALAEVFQQGGQGIVLVPEIALTPQTINRFAARFPGRLAVIHSQLSPGERYDEWRRIRDGRADIVIGPVSAIFAPLPRLRLIIVDEEHEWSYKRQETPNYHARDVAVKLSELTGALVILGSATPDVGSYYRAQRGDFRLLELPQRIMGHRADTEPPSEAPEGANRHQQAAIHGPDHDGVHHMDLPPVQIVDLRAELRSGNRSPFSRALHAAMTATLDAREQVILFLNRRGSSTFVMCRDCGYVASCPNCDVPLVYHDEAVHLRCHRCNYQCEVPQVCPKCGSGRIRHFGLGTQKVVQLVHELFPQARVLRWDRDVTSAKGAHERILERFVSQKADVLVGTQMVAKGLDLPRVTLVGVISADTALYLPDFRAGERTFQLLTQVAGRAGRSALGGKVIIQTYAPDHPCIQAASHHDYHTFYTHEIAFRREHGYPPFGRLVRMVYAHANQLRCKEESAQLSLWLQQEIARLGLSNADVIGPSPCFVQRLRGKYRWQLMLRGTDLELVLEQLSLPRGWNVDVDPVSML